MQYVAWLGGVLRGDLGWSGVAVAPVSDVLPARFVATMELATSGALIAIFFGVALGRLRRRPAQPHGRPRHAVITVSGASLPLFWFALLTLILFYLVIPIAPARQVRPGHLSARSPTTPASTRSIRS